MTAPAASYIRLPQDGGYSGGYVRVVQRTIGSDVTYTHAYAKIDSSKINGLYFFDGGTPSAVQASAQDGTSTGFLWFQNPSASVNMRIRHLRVSFANATGGAISHNSAPRIGFCRGTFTGTASGATLTLAKRKTTDAANVGSIRTAVTGMTVTVGDPFWAPLVPGNDITGAVDVFNAQVGEEWQPGSSDEYITLAQNECVVVYQMDNGTASDQRLIHFAGVFDEVDVT